MSVGSRGIGMRKGLSFGSKGQKVIQRTGLAGRDEVNHKIEVFLAVAAVGSIVAINYLSGQSDLEALSKALLSF